jgi:tetratricopeptide (TPR) repeat protein
MEAALTVTPATLFGAADKSLLRRISALLRRTWVRCAILALLGFAVRFPALQGQLIWDDQYLAHDNPFIKSPLLILESFRHHLFLDSFSAHYRPVQNISYIFDYLVWNTDPYGFHLSNVLWHIASGILLYLLLDKLLGGLVENGLGLSAISRSRLSGAAFFVALLWVVHPVHSAAVDYISGRADSLAFFFSCASWLLYLRASRASGRRPALFFYLAAAFSLLLALSSRETACVWLLLFFAHLFIFEKTVGPRKKILVLVASLMVVAVYAGLRLLPESHRTVHAATEWSAPVRATLMLRALGDYGRLMLWPSNLHMERTVFDPDSLQSSAGWRQEVGVEYLSIAGLLVAAALILGICRKGRAQPVRVFGALWFLVAYLPISNLISLNATVAEHWLYLPSVGFLIFAVGCCLELPRKGMSFASLFVCLACVGLSARSFVRSTDWVDEETFYRRTLVAGGTSIRVALNLGHVYASRGEYAKAEALFRRVLQISPDYPVARTNLGDALFHQGKIEEAEAVFATARETAVETRKEYPRTWVAALNVAHMYHNDHDDAAALAAITKARNDYPGVWELVSFEAELTRRTRGAGDALRLVKDFAHSHWWHAGAFMALGQLYAEIGDANQAEVALRHASWLDIHDAESLNLIVAMQVRQNRLDTACTTQRRAVARQPDQPRQYLMLSDILEKMGRHNEAQAALSQVHLLQALAKSQPSARAGLAPN